MKFNQLMSVTRKYRFYFVVIGLLSLCSCSSFNLRVAENYYQEYAYAKAIPKYEKGLMKDFIPEAAHHLAESYRKVGNSVQAEIWYKRLVKSPHVNPDDRLNLAEVLMENGKYGEAKMWFQDYLQYSSNNKKVKRLIQACDSIHLFFKDTVTFNISLLRFNKENESNFSPAYYRQGLVFLSDRSAPDKNDELSTWTGKEYLDLFYTTNVGNDNWLEPELLKGDVNGLYDEGPAVFSSDNTTIYFTRTDYSGKVIEKNQKDISLLKLYYGKLYGNQWKLETLLPFNNTDYSVGHPAISQNGRKFYFVSDMPWGYGGTDIYEVNLNNGKWSEPKNLGPGINTEGNEMFPFISADSTIYFASDGHFGLGGLDIFSSYWDGANWTKPENLQHPVNSSKDDFGFIIDSSNTSGYFSSNRVKNTDKIFGFKKSLHVFSYNLAVYDKKNAKAVKDFSLLDNNGESGEPALAKGSDGNLKMNLSRNTDYDLMLKGKGYYARPLSISTVGKRKSEVLIDTMTVEKIELNKSVVWKSIYFNKKELNITPKTALALDSLVFILEMNPELQIEISSHTDSRGAFGDNLTLSRKRSDEIAMYLINKGINPPRLISIGYGESKLLNNCRDGILCLEEDHRQNNRVEIKVIDLMR